MIYTKNHFAINIENLEKLLTLNDLCKDIIEHEMAFLAGNEIPKETMSQEYIRKFIDMYKNVGFRSSASSANGGPVRECNSSEGDKSWSLFGWSLGGEGRETRELDVEGTISPSEEFVFTIPRDPLLSPYLASDSLLSRMPPIKLLASIR